MTPLIALSTSTLAHEAGTTWPFACGTNRSYIEWVERAGGAPVLLPNVGPELVDALLEPVHGLLLTGGEDLAPLLYGADPHPRVGRYDVPRDRFELPLARRALALGLPIFGICRGLQTLNVALGGTLVQDLGSCESATVGHRMGAVGGHATHHRVTVSPGSRLAAILGEESLAVNSYHHQAVETLGQGLAIVARAADGTVEALAGEGDAFLLAVQWHPEVMEAAHAPSAKLFGAFLEACAARL